MKLFEIDNDFCSNTLAQAFERSQKKLPLWQDIKSGQDIEINGNYGVNVHYTIPETGIEGIQEILPLAELFLKKVRFEELLLLYTLMLNEKKIILVSNSVQLLGSAL